MYSKRHVGKCWQHILWQAAQKQLVEKVAVVAVATIGFWVSFLSITPEKNRWNYVEFTLYQSP